MKKLIAVVLLALLATGCATHRETYSPSGQAAHSLTCSGTARDWNMCYKAAGDICKTRGFTIIDKAESTNRQVFASYGSTGGQYQNAAVVERNMTVVCK